MTKQSDDIEILSAAGGDVTVAKKALEIGDRLKEGKLTTVILGFDENKDPIRVPEGVFIGKAKFEDQDKAIAEANDKLGLKGQKALTRLHNHECALLAKDWDKVASPAQQGSAAEWFWGRTLDERYNGGRVFRGGEADSYGIHFHSKYGSRPVPAALRGPVQG
jgi:hypothetical protein